MTTNKKTKVNDPTKRNEMKNRTFISIIWQKCVACPLRPSFDNLVYSKQIATFAGRQASTICLIQLTLQLLLGTELSDLNNCSLLRRLTFLFARFQLSTNCVCQQVSESQIPHNIQFVQAFTPRSTHRLTLFQWRELLESNGRTMCQNTASPSCSFCD